MSQFRSTPVAAATLMVLSGTCPVLAQQQSGTLPEVKVTAPLGQGFQTESTRGATRTETPLRDIPQFINVVPQQLIQSQQATTFVDALRNVPGITYGAAEGGTAANNVFFMRGFQVVGDIYLDGMRDLGEYNRDLFAIDSIEVLKGPSALAFGRGSPGGIVNQIAKYPHLSRRAEISATFGHHGERRVVGDLNMPMAGDHAFRLVALREDSDIYRDTVEVRKTGVAPSIRFGVGTGTDLTLGYYYLKTNDITDYGQPNLGAAFGFAPPPVSLKKYYGFAKHDFTDHETHIATAKLDKRISDSVQLRNTLRWANYRRTMEATIPSINKTDANGNAVTAATPIDLLLVNRSHNKSRDTDDEVLINQTDVTWKLSTGAVKHTVLGGLELARESLHRMNYTFAGTVAAPTPLLNPDPHTTLSYTKTPNQYSPARADTLAVFMQDQAEFSPQWKALLGVRWERIKSTVRTEDIATGMVTATGGPFSRTDTTWAGRAGVIWQPNEHHSYYISAGNSYNPSGQLGVYGANGTSLSATNDDLEPEENRSYEIGSQWDFESGVQVRASIFRNEKINQRIPPEPGSNLPPILGGKRRVDGVELAASGHVTPNWDIYGAFAFFDGKIVKSNVLNTEGKDPYGTPQTSGNVWTVYRLGGGWEVGGGAFYSADWFLNDANTARAPSYVRWDATAAYVRDAYEIRLNVLNFTDRRHYLGGYENAGNRLIPGQPLTALLTLTYRYR